MTPEPSSESRGLFVLFPTGRDGKDIVGINIGEIASFRSHEVSSYTYEQWVLVSLKNGKEHDVKLTMREFQKRITDAVAEEAGL